MTVCIILYEVLQRIEIYGISSLFFSIYILLRTVQVCYIAMESYNSRRSISCNPLSVHGDPIS
jgi:hypothetical protein